MIERTECLETINYVLKHPCVKDHINDDASKELDIVYPIQSNIYYLAGYCGCELSAMFVFYPLNCICYDSHSAVLPHSYGEPGRELGRMAISWMFSHTSACKLVGNTPVNNKLAVKYAESVGYAREGINRRSIMKDGMLIDQVYFGLEREKWAGEQR